MRAVLCILALAVTASACSADDRAREADAAQGPAGDAAVRDPGGFERVVVPLGHPTAAIRVLDLDGDGAAEVLAGGGPSVAVLGVGDGGVEVRAVMRAGDHPVDLAVGDLDGDGRTDLVVANHDTDYVTVVMGAADGFGTARRVGVDVSPHPHAVALADVTGDGRPEVLVDDRDAEALRVFRPDGSGGLEPLGRIPVGGDPYRGMAVADVDGDDDLDVLSPNPADVAVQHGDGAGSFTPGPTLRPPGFRPFTAAAGDFDGDGTPDIAAGSGEGPGGAMIWLGDGQGGFRPAPGSPFEIADGPTASAVADVDGDGIDDLLLTSWSGELAIVHGGREGHRVQRIELRGSPWGVDAGDIDGDGEVDIVVGQGDGDGVIVLLGRSEVTPQR